MEYRAVKDALLREDWSDPMLCLYEVQRQEMEARRGIPGAPTSDAKATRATLLEVGRVVGDCQSMVS